MSYTGFKNLGVQRYKRALHLLKQNTTGIFTKKQGFDVNNTDNLTNSQKSKIRRYWREFDHLTSRPHEPIAIKDKAKLRAVQKASFQSHYLGKFNKAFVPSDGKLMPVIKYDKKTKDVTIKLGKIERRLFMFDKMLLATDPAAAVAKIMKKAKNARMFKIQCGQFEYNYMSSNDLDHLTRTIQKFQNQYANHNQWLNGLVAYYYEDNKDFNDTINSIQRGREELRKRRLALKRKNLKEVRKVK